MSHVTTAFAKVMLDYAERGQHSPLTVWEEKQLAYSFLRRKFLEDCIESVLSSANGQTPDLVYVGKDYTLGELRHALLAALHDPMPPDVKPLGSVDPAHCRYVAPTIEDPNSGGMIYDPEKT